MFMSALLHATSPFRAGGREIGPVPLKCGPLRPQGRWWESRPQPRDAVRPMWMLPRPRSHLILAVAALPYDRCVAGRAGAQTQAGPLATCSRRQVRHRCVEPLEGGPKWALLMVPSLVSPPLSPSPERRGPGTEEPRARGDAPNTPSSQASGSGGDCLICLVPNRLGRRGWPLQPQHAAGVVPPDGSWGWFSGLGPPQGPDPTRWRPRSIRLAQRPPPGKDVSAPEPLVPELVV